MNRDLGQALPAAFVVARAGTRLEGWGRLAALTPVRIELDTLMTVAEGEIIELGFALGGVPFRNLRARIQGVTRLPDGYGRAALTVERPEDSRALREAILPFLSTTTTQTL